MPDHVENNKKTNNNQSVKRDTHTDQEAAFGSFIAYAEFSSAYRKLRAENPEETSFTIQKLAEVYENEFQMDKITSNVLENLPDDLKKNWKISAIYDDNDVSGLYSCIIETGDNNCICAFRGSEQFWDIDDTNKKYDQLEIDWIISDIGSCGNDDTLQEKETANVLKVFAPKLKQYNNITPTGHSLGANVTGAFMVEIAKNGYLNDLNIDRAKLFDGPGYSHKYIEANNVYIEEIADLIDSYKFSFVGDSLIPLPGTREKYISVDPDKLKNVGVLEALGNLHLYGVSKISGIEKYDGGLSEQLLLDYSIKALLNDYVMKHSLEFVIFDNNGSVITGEQDAFAKEWHDSTVKIDKNKYSSQITSFIQLTAIEFIESLRKSELEDKNKDSKKVFSDAIKYFTKIQMMELSLGLKFFSYDFTKKIKNKEISKANAYFEENPSIKCSTEGLREIANEINEANRKLASIHDNLISLYFQVKWTDLKKIYDGRLNIHYSYKLEKCSSYLLSIADKLEEAEKQIVNLFV